MDSEDLDESLDDDSNDDELKSLSLDDSVHEQDDDEQTEGKSCIGSMGSSFDVRVAGVGQNAGVESTLMVVSPLKSRIGESGVKIFAM